MSRRWLVVIEDPESEFHSPEELQNLLEALAGDILGKVKIALVRRGGILADKVMDELPPVRHKDQGVYR